MSQGDSRCENGLSEDPTGDPVTTGLPSGILSHVYITGTPHISAPFLGHGHSSALDILIAYHMCGSQRATWHSLCSCSLSLCSFQAPQQRGGGGGGGGSEDQTVTGIHTPAASSFPLQHVPKISTAVALPPQVPHASRLPGSQHSPLASVMCDSLQQAPCVWSIRPDGQHRPLESITPETQSFGAYGHRTHHRVRSYGVRVWGSKSEKANQRMVSECVCACVCMGGGGGGAMSLRKDRVAPIREEGGPGSPLSDILTPDRCTGQEISCHGRHDYM